MQLLSVSLVFELLFILAACAAKDQKDARSSSSSAAPASPAEASTAENAANTLAEDKGVLLMGAAATDPGVRTSPPGAGGPLVNLSSTQQNYFYAGQSTFAEVDSVAGNLPSLGGGNGLGPVFNGNSCAGCHAYPAQGGSSPKVNPQIALATAYGATNEIPFFLSENGPVREARFKYATNPNGSLSSVRDGGVHDLFTITGRYDAGNCSLAQPDFVAANSAGNLSLRIPTPLFGAGLIESISDTTITQSFNSTATLRQIWGINGHPNTSANDGTITRFGWKAQNKSLMMFAGEAYNVEQGVTNELFPSERVSNVASCLLNATPEDHTNYNETNPTAAASDIVMFAAYMRMLAPPTPVAQSASAKRGAAVFTQVACSLCHTPSMAISQATVYAQTQQASANLYSDLMLHHMGANLADDIVQGGAGPDEFRTAPLWGVGQRLFFLHDGRTSDIVQAILQHYSVASTLYPASEANLAVEHFLALPAGSQQDLVNFLRTL